MGMHVIKMPDIGEGIAEVELVAWRVAVGDKVVPDQILADVMTDKATVELPSPVAGKVVALGGAVGQMMAVGAEVIRIEVPGTGNLPALDATLASVGPRPVAMATPATLPAPVQATAHPDAVQAQPSADKPIASPAVRRRAWERGIELPLVAGTGLGGRIMQADLEAYVAHGAPSPSAVQKEQRVVPQHEEDKEIIPLVGLRRKIAQKMQESKRRIPHFTYVEEVDVTALEALRAQLNAEWGEARGHLTLLPFVMLAVVRAVAQYPQVNAHFDDEAAVLTRHRAVHLGIATQTEAGLMVPVVRHVETRDVWACAGEVLRLAQAARSGRITRDELTGSTLTLTSLGALGGIVSTPIINRPEVAIVGINRMVERPMIHQGLIAKRQMMNLSSSFDHRVVDGQQAAAFVQLIRAGLECPATLFMG